LIGGVLKLISCCGMATIIIVANLATVRPGYKQLLSLSAS
jgi:hypothetical protein